MILAVDVQYNDHMGTAHVGGVSFSDWSQASPDQTYTSDVTGVAPYVPGAFYLRELPCIEALLTEHDLKPKVIVVDGYVSLKDGLPGLGQHLYETLGGSVPIVGVAKTYFPSDLAVKVCRGGSASPLYVSSVGFPVAEAADLVSNMHGLYRIPTLLKLVDQLARNHS